MKKLNINDLICTKSISQFLYTLGCVLLVFIAGAAQPLSARDGYYVVLDIDSETVIGGGFFKIDNNGLRWPYESKVCNTKEAPPTTPTGRTYTISEIKYGEAINIVDEDRRYQTRGNQWLAHSQLNIDYHLDKKPARAWFGGKPMRPDKQISETTAVLKVINPGGSEPKDCVFNNTSGKSFKKGNKKDEESEGGIHRTHCWYQWQGEWYFYHC